MKRGLLFVTLCVLTATQPAWAQKFGYVDTDFIFSKLPEYQKAQAGIDQFADRWSKDILDKQAEIDKMQRAYQAEEILLTDEMKRERQRVISDKEREVREYNNKVFGYEGLLLQKKKELMKAPMELLQKALEKVAAQRKLNFIFDKASEGMLMLYTDPRHDYTDYVMEEMGLDPDSQKGKQSATTQPTNSAKPK
ncbi:OmpH family outer membrane protein [Fibrella sp. HMF5335]|uniref:OmpH family outer membrane protein n=1 Tax=Fibrella rubiginis TaxID=2817060 RepID=A0A939JZG3_9BACT|nr:OmpH family outer membrane protein [Fibrella rubiginis]MBO0935032.1 OmpH family outer membrane protein [Fibrella rubiginis]